MEQQHHTSAGAVHAPRTLDVTLPQLQHSSNSLSRPAAPSPAAGESAPHSEVKRCQNFRVWNITSQYYGRLPLHTTKSVRKRISRILSASSCS
ncbi:unnamed protein product [Haemonchus placei]|uniref:Uncharacterized protein n=1 Tax=Haemonchus placei TaxID=6290 RepID=A0A0N4WJS8_HAEPC|nr:unnamed protein product [Haemonchus placei]